MISYDKYLKRYNKKFYKTYIWQIKRKEILERDNFECQECKSKGLMSKASTVHHIKEYKEFPSLALTDTNLISLCRNCHEEKHPDRLEKFEETNPLHEERWE